MASSVSAVYSTISVAPASVNTGVDAVVTVTAKDADNAALGVDLTVVIAATGTGNTVTQPEGGVTNSSGVGVGAVKSSAEAIKVISATVDDVVLTNVVQLKVDNTVYSSVNADPQNESLVKLSTVPRYDPASPYEVLRYGEPLVASPNKVPPLKDWNAIGVSATLGYEDTGLQVNRQYSYRVRAIDDDGNFKGYTEAVDVKTLAEDTASAPDALPTFPPWKIAAAGVSTTGITLVWTADVAGDATQFEIQRKG